MSEAVKRSLATKLSELYAVVERVPKNGTNTFHGYKYATEADVAAAFRLALADRQIIILPSVTETKLDTFKTAKGRDQFLCTLTVSFKIMDGESGESQTVVTVGQGSDDSDKAAFKAMTGAVKYMLMKLALVPTGDDPEADESPARAQTTSGEMRNQIDQHMGRDPRPSPPRDADSQMNPQTGEVRQPPDAPAPNYGRNKGEMLSRLDVAALRFYEGGCLKTLADPGKSNYHGKEQTTLTAIRAWIAFRS